MSETKRKRNNEIVNERLAGRTYRSIGEEYGLSTNRVRQICEKENAIKRYQEMMKEKRILLAEREKYLDEHGRLDGLTPRLYNAVRAAKLGKPSLRKREVCIDGVIYESVADAMRKLNVCTRKLYKLLEVN